MFVDHVCHDRPVIRRQPPVTGSVVDTPVQHAPRLRNQDVVEPTAVGTSREVMVGAPGTGRDSVDELRCLAKRLQRRAIDVFVQVAEYCGGCRLVRDPRRKLLRAPQPSRGIALVKMRVDEQEPCSIGVTLELQERGDPREPCLWEARPRRRRVVAVPACLAVHEPKALKSEQHQGLFAATFAIVATNAIASVPGEAPTQPVRLKRVCLLNASDVWGKALQALEHRRAAAPPVVAEIDRPAITNIERDEPGDAVGSAPTFEPGVALHRSEHRCSTVSMQAPGSLPWSGELSPPAASEASSNGCITSPDRRGAPIGRRSRRAPLRA